MARIRLVVSVLAAVATLVTTPSFAYPPAPHHLLYGTVRDEFGTPLMSPRAQVVLQTSTGVQYKTSIIAGLSEGVNYRLEVPMDANITTDLYTATALKTGAQFKLYVIVPTAAGMTTNVPIQMSGSFVALGQPGQETRLDLTVGVDSNGDGIPDAWEYAFLSALGLNLSLSDLNANMDLAHDGRTLMEEYLLGNYPFNPDATFSVKLVQLNGGSPWLEFSTMNGRSYTVFGSADLKTWTPISFFITSEGAAAARSFYCAPDIRSMQVQVVQPTNGPEMRFFKLMLQ